MRLLLRTAVVGLFCIISVIGYRVRRPREEKGREEKEERAKLGQRTASANEAGRSVGPRHSTSTSQKLSAERRLYDRLFEDYDPGCRPVINATSTVTVSLAFSLNQIMDLVEKNQTLMTQLWIYQEWMDETLMWNPALHEGISSLIVQSASLWLPDVYIFNNADNGDEGFVSLNQSRATVRHDGHIQWIVPLIVQSACAVDVTYFPFDKQSCYIMFGSWIYDASQMNLTLTRDNVDISSYSPNTELNLIEVSVSRNESRGRERPQIVARLLIRRKPLYYAYTLLAPTLVLCILNLFSFLLPCDNGDKVGIGLTVFLSLYVLQLAIAENIPESNSLPLIGLFLTLVMTLNAISLMCATLVINIKKKGDLRYCPHVPDGVMNFFKGFLGRITCTPFVNFYHYYGNCEEPGRKKKSCSKAGGTRDAILKAAGATSSGINNNQITKGGADKYSSYRLGVNNVGDNRRLSLVDPLERTALYQHRKTEREELRMYPVEGSETGCRARGAGLLSETDANLTVTGNGAGSRRASSVSMFGDAIKRFCQGNNGTVDGGLRRGSTAPGDLTASAGRDDRSLFGGPSSDDDEDDVYDETEPRDPRYEWFFVAEILDKTLFLLFFLTMLTTVLVSLVLVPWIHR